MTTDQTPHLNRRTFLQQTSLATAGSLLALDTLASAPDVPSPTAPKTRLAMVGTGSRGASMWGTSVQKKYADVLEFVGLCDTNPGRLETVKKRMGVSCPTFTDFETMMRETKPDTLIVTTVDATHDRFIIRGMELGANIITEKPMTTDEKKCRAILDAEKRTGKKVTVTFNYRYSPHREKLYDLLRQGVVGDITSVDFHWYLDVHHGADYFRRWHRRRENSGTLLVHKASHHFDLLNWWIDSDPVEVFANGSLDFYGKKGPYRHTNCRPCPHKTECPFYWDVTKNGLYKALYVDNEHHDGYLRDGCVFKEDIDIYDKMGAVVKYANGTQVTYSLTTYSPYEGYRITFNGTKGRLEAWIHETGNYDKPKDDELFLYHNFGKTEKFTIPQSEGHGGGDDRMKDKIFRTPAAPDTFSQSAGSRDGAFAILVGVAARTSIDTGKPVKLASLVDLKPQIKRARGV
jgi:predicted dehydrogenase